MLRSGNIGSERRKFISAIGSRFRRTLRGRILLPGMGRDNTEKNKPQKRTLSRPTSWAGDHRYLLKRVPPTTISVATGFSTLLAPTLTGSPTGSIFFAIPT